LKIYFVNNIKRDSE